MAPHLSGHPIVVGIYPRRVTQDIHYREHFVNGRSTATSVSQYLVDLHLRKHDATHGQTSQVAQRCLFTVRLPRRQFD